MKDGSQEFDKFLDEIEYSLGETTQKVERNINESRVRDDQKLEDLNKQIMQFTRDLKLMER